jgi:hypothetical protein
VTGPGGTAISTITPGREIVLSGSGYAPFSTVALYVYSTPRSLGTVTADATGSFSTTVTIPAGLEAGAHHLVAAGVDPGGAVRYLRTDVTLPAASSSSTGPELAWTGFEALPFAVAGGLAVVAGAGFLVLARRRRAS